MSVSNMRAAIAQVYSGQSWKYKVAKMPEQQVMAVYFSFVQRKLI